MDGPHGRMTEGKTIFPPPRRGGGIKIKMSSTAVKINPFRVKQNGFKVVQLFIVLSN